MDRFTDYISSQFKNPHGFVGKIICFIQNTLNDKMYKKAASLVDVRANEIILDIGYGNGHLLELIYKKKAVEMYGVDISNDAKEMAIKRNRKAYESGKLHLQVGDCCNLPFENEIFSTVTSINTIYFWADTVKGLSEIKRTLKQGCSFYNVMFTREYLDTVKYTQIGYKKFDAEELIKFGKEAGFDKIEIRDIQKGKSFVVIYTRLS